MTPKDRSDIPIGTRVCVYWSQMWNCLFPGTIELLESPDLKDNLILVALDDGDTREVDISSIRLLPPNYSLVGMYNKLIPNSIQFFISHFSLIAVGQKIKTK